MGLDRNFETARQTIYPQPGGRPTSCCRFSDAASARYLAFIRMVRTADRPPR